MNTEIYYKDKNNKNNRSSLDQERYNNKPLNNKKIYGKINVYSVMDNKNGKSLEGMKINLYRINGVSPHLVKSKFTDSNGMVQFENIYDGNYRVIEIIDKSLYEKPTYVNWNEVNISEYSKEETIYVINKKKILN